MEHFDKVKETITGCDNLNFRFYRFAVFKIKKGFPGKEANFKSGKKLI